MPRVIGIAARRRRRNSAAKTITMMWFPSVTSYVRTQMPKRNRGIENSNACRAPFRANRDMRVFHHFLKRSFSPFTVDRLADSRCLPTQYTDAETTTEKRHKLPPKPIAITKSHFDSSLSNSFASTIRDRAKPPMRAAETPMEASASSRKCSFSCFAVATSRPFGPPRRADWSSSSRGDIAHRTPARACSGTGPARGRPGAALLP
mmetsp:Transcript_46312/g.130945  ORF Transcript_46312/g.130945 Transcript_46312/m.130945 type:complete len:205 (-) Transcript_46312:30-644(-)